MGHYRSEMGYEAQDAQEAKDKKERLDRITKTLEKEIKKHGIARVLAEILEENSRNLYISRWG
jgi:hypothetical protein